MSIVASAVVASGGSAGLAAQAAKTGAAPATKGESWKTDKEVQKSADSILTWLTPHGREGQSRATIGKAFAKMSPAAVDTALLYLAYTGKLYKCGAETGAATGAQPTYQAMSCTSHRA